MTNLEKYENLFVEVLGAEKESLPGLVYQSIPDWDSVGHMTLVAEIESVFDIFMDIDDVINFSSFEKGKEILKKYDLEI